MTTSNQIITGTEFNAAASMSELINEQLHQDSFFHPNLGGITRGGMSNHFPMTVLSLQGLAASDGEVQAFINTWPRYRTLIQDDLALVDTGQLKAENWTAYLGQPRFLLEFRRVFLDGLNSSDNKEMYIATLLDCMSDSLPMGLFHPLIRISFACMHGDNGLIADALAYMAIRYLDLFQSSLEQSLSGLNSDTEAVDSWQAISQSVAKTRVKAPVVAGSLHICEQFCSEPDIQAVAFSNGFDINDENLESRIQEICQCALRLYLFEPALTTLHAVTAAQALADLTLRCTSVSNSREVFIDLWRRYWVWLTGLYLEKGHPAQLPEIDPAVETEIDKADWQDLAALARKIPEVHLIKMVFSCKWLHENVEDSHYYKLAVINILREQNAHPDSSYGLCI
ncbi:MAG: questin oxidase family protein [Amphritea sp.]